MPKQKIIVFTRFPEPGQVKTRLISALGENGAANLHREMSEHTINLVCTLARSISTEIEVRFDGGDLAKMKSWLGMDLNYESQGMGDLGERMARALEDNFLRGYRRIVLIGTDCPQLTVFHLRAALQALKSHDVVLGPAGDGGYYLIGLKRIFPQLFNSIDWGSERVFDQTLNKVKIQGASFQLLGELYDVDEETDLPYWHHTRNQTISIIIPALNEEKNIQSALESTGEKQRNRIIVVDGGSQDNTVRIAREWGASVFESQACRGKQMNLGARNAPGNILLFLHADTLLPRDYSGLIKKALSNQEILGGYFHLKFEPPSAYLHFKERKISLRTRLFKLPFGDQAFFVRASVFRHMGGYAEISIMEDVDFIRRLNKMGKLVCLPAPVVTSSRRFIRHGPLRATVMNKIIFYSYFLGIDPERLARMYYRGSPQDPSSL